MKNRLLVLLTIPVAVVGWSQDFANALPAAAVESGRIDKLGRLMVNGKPFMPIGFYPYQVIRKNIEIPGGRPLNGITFYDSCFLNVNHRDGLVQGIAETLDASYAKKIKWLFALRPPRAPHGSDKK